MRRECINIRILTWDTLSLDGVHLSLYGEPYCYLHIFTYTSLSNLENMFHSNFSLQSEAKEAYPLVYSSFEKGYRKKTKQNKTKQKCINKLTRYASSLKWHFLSWIFLKSSGQRRFLKTTLITFRVYCVHFYAFSRQPYSKQVHKRLMIVFYHKRDYKQ